MPLPSLCRLFLLQLFIASAAVVAEVVPFLAKPRPGDGLLSSSGQCSMELYSLDRQLRQPVDPPTLNAHWVSPECEVLPGPIFQLRAFQFYQTGSFLLRHYRYEDDACSRPTEAFISEGRLKHMTRSWRVLGASESSVQLDSVYAIPYTRAAAERLTASLRRHCRVAADKLFHWPDLHVYRQVLVYKREERPLDEIESTDEIDCIDAVNFTIAELELLRMEEWQRPNEDFFVKSLYFGQPLWSAKNNAFRLATHFQPELRRSDEAFDCKTCKKVRDANRLSPPLLRAKAAAAAASPLEQLDGDWLSARCESHINGVFVQRQLSFAAASRGWSLRQRHFDDPFCRRPRFSFEASGQYEPLDGAAPRLSATQAVRLHVERLRLLPESKYSVRHLRHTGNCGADTRLSWRAGRSVDLTAAGGCAALGLEVPSARTDIVRVELRDGRPPLLFTGFLDESAEAVPTSYRSPLTKCDRMSVVISVYVGDASTDGHFTFWKAAGAPAASNSLVSVVFGLVLLLLLSSR